MRIAQQLVCASLFIILLVSSFHKPLVLADIEMVFKVPPEGQKWVTIEREWSKVDIMALIDKKGLEYGVATSTINAVVKCESGYNPKVVGDNGTSFGLVQIHQPAHKQITKEQAFDPEFAIDFLASNLAKGNGRLWTCYNMLYL